MKKFLLLLMLFVMTATPAAAQKILYIPIDSRPCNLWQVVQVAEKLDCEIITPPNELLGTRENRGEPDAMWAWLNENAAGADCAVLSTDSLIYGSLVASCLQNLEPSEIMERAKRFAELKKNFPHLQIYAIGTIMRTPRSGGYASGEPDYYTTYGAKIFNYTALLDRQETQKLSGSDKRKLKNLAEEIPEEYINDWMNRRAKNFDANKYLIDLTRAGTFEYFLLGCDDSAMFSQTHRESRHLTEYSADLGKTVVQVTSGADELGMLMVSRAINHHRHFIPFVSVEYNAGTGAKTFPSYCNEPIGISIDAAIIAVGGLRIPAHERADLVLAVNTRANGKTFEAGDVKRNKPNLRGDIKTFMEPVKKFIAAGYPVAIGDIAFGNGADNSLMRQLELNDLQYKIRAYGGWNIATNATGFLIGSGVLTPFMNEEAIAELLTTRYLDEWIYQANVRNEIVAASYAMPSDGNPLNLKNKLPALEQLLNERMKAFTAENLHLPSRYRLEKLSVKLPWQRTFECDPRFSIVAD